MIRRPRSLRFRVLAVAVLLVVAGMMVVNLIALLTLRANLLAKVDQELLAVPGEAFGPLVQQLPPPNSVPSPQAANSGFLNNQVITMLDASTGSVIDQLVGPAVRDAPLPDLATVTAQVQSGQIPSGLETVGGVDDPSYLYRIRVIQPAANTAQVVVIAKSLADIRSTLVRVGMVDAAVSLVLLGALIAIGRPVMRVGLQPLTDVDEAAARIGSGDLSVRVPHGDEPGEVGHLSRTFNEMAKEIEGAFREQHESQIRLRQFVSDASHELRTPLTSIRAYAELLRKGALPADPGSRQASERIEAEAERMSALVNDLLLLARLDEQRSTEPTHVDLGQLVDEMATDISMTAPTHAMTCSVAPGAIVLGDEAQFRQLIGNMLRNAVVHTPEGTSVEASVEVSDPDVWLVVADDGPGMARDVAEHAFERFFRPEPGRTRGAGTGLGLAIVDAVATTHGGSVALETTPGSGTRFIVRLPSVREPEQAGANAQPILRFAGGSPEAGAAGSS